MDDVGKWNSYLIGQRRLIPVTETDLILTLTVPLSSESEVFRIGWDLKRPSGRGYVAITTGRATWNRGHMLPAAEHICVIMDECNFLLGGNRDPERT